MARLTLVSTPIGNLADLSPRASEALRSAELWIVEDTRVSGKLQTLLDVKRRMIVLNEHTSDAGLEKVRAEVASSEGSVLLTDGGTPVISDPGARLVDVAHEMGIEVDSIPGPSAVTNALALSGFFGQRFAFLGFPPRKPGPIRSLLGEFADSPLTLVLFESPFRIDALLESAHEALGGRRYALCREMTKLHQQIFRAQLPMIPSNADVPRKGEFTVVFEGQRRTRVDSD